MKVKNVMKDLRKLIVDCKVVILKPGEKVSGNKIVYESNSFEEIKEKDDLSIVKKKKLNKENNK